MGDTRSLDYIHMSSRLWSKLLKGGYIGDKVGGLGSKLLIVGLYKG